MRWYREPRFRSSERLWDASPSLGKERSVETDSVEEKTEEAARIEQRRRRGPWKIKYLFPFQPLPYSRGCSRPVACNGLPFVHDKAMTRNKCGHSATLMKMALPCQSSNSNVEALPSKICNNICIHSPTRNHNHSHHTTTTYYNRDSISCRS